MSFDINIDNDEPSLLNFKYHVNFNFLFQFCYDVHLISGPPRRLSYTGNVCRVEH